MGLQLHSPTLSTAYADDGSFNLWDTSNLTSVDFYNTASYSDLMGLKTGSIVFTIYSQLLEYQYKPPNTGILTVNYKLPSQQ